MGEVKGATKYVLEKSIDDKTYALIAEFPGKGVVDQIEQEVGVTYYFRLKACNSENRCSGWVKASLKQTTKAPKLSLTTTSKKVTATIKSVNGADGYRLYMSTKKNGKYDMVKEFTSEEELLEFTSKTKKGKTYYYKVRSYRVVSESKVYSPFSSIKSIKSK